MRKKKEKHRDPNQLTEAELDAQVDIYLTETETITMLEIVPCQSIEAESSNQESKITRSCSRIKSDLTLTTTDKLRLLTWLRK